MLRSLRGQLIVGMTLTVALVMALFTWHITERQQSTAMEQHIEQAHALADSLAVSSAVWVASRDFSGLQEIVQGLSEYPNLTYVLVLGNKGQVIAHSDPSKIGLYINNISQVYKNKLQGLSNRTIDVIHPIMLSSRQVGWVRIGFDRSVFFDELSKIRQSGFIYALMAVILSAVIVSLATRYLTRRLYKIQQVADRVQVGENLRVEISGKDETARLAQQFNNMLDSLEQREKQLSSFYSLDLVGLAITSPEKGWIRVNDHLCKMLGYSEQELLNLTWDEITHPDDLEADIKQFGRLLANKINGYTLEKRFIRQTGAIISTKLVVACVRKVDGQVDYVLAMVDDITQRKNDAKKIEHLAFYDPLTGVANRRLLMDRLKQALTLSFRSGRKGSLLFLDLDNFKILNDTLGHDVGDSLLQQAAERLKSCIRKGDSIARFGGDEFVIILSGLSEDTTEAASQTEAISHKILMEFRKSYSLAQQNYLISTSIGAVLFGEHASSIDEVLKQADIAMYQAKKSGGDSLRFFDPKMQASITDRVELEHELNSAIEKQEFQLYYQLQVGVNEKALGAEALIRWNHPKRGILAPNNFIPLAEETGGIIAIGQWVLETACKQLKAWQQNELTANLSLAVNVSAKQFHQTDFFSQVEMLIQKYSINPNLLKLELTESSLLDNIENTVVLMNKFADIGVQFSLDDFGTGYSSLQYLKKLPLYQLKIDQSFVLDILNDHSDRIIIKTIISMAHSLGLSAIAEGVETEEHYQCLLGEGCRAFQGYLFSKPIPIVGFDELLKSRSIASIS